MNNFKKSAIAVAVTSALGVAAPVSANPMDLVYVDFTGLFTMLNPDGSAAFNNSDFSTNAFYGNRTNVAGSMMFNTTTGAGTGSMLPFSFGSADNAAATNITFQSIGNNLVLGNLGFNWSGNNGIPVSIVLDATGFFGAMGGGLTTSDNISGVGSLAATDDFSFGGKGSYTLPLGPVPLATTTWNTTNIGTVGLGSNPSGTVPLTADTIGGSPMQTAPFLGWNANFDITGLHVTSVVDTHVPVPAAVWLFGSGLMGLVGVARRRKSKSA